MQRLGDVLRRANQFDEAYAMLTEGLETRRRHMSAETEDIADSYNNLGILAVAMGKFEEADRLQSESVAMYTRLVGPRSPDLAVPLNNLALDKRRQGRFDEALDLATRAYEILRTTTDRDSMWLARSNIAGIKRSMGAVEEAQEIWEDLLRQARPELGPTHTRVEAFERDVIACLIERGEYSQAESRLEDLEQRAHAAQGARSMRAALLLATRGRMDLRRNRLAAAEREFREALDLHLAITGPTHFRIPEYRRQLAEVLALTGHLQEAEAELRQALAILPDASSYPYLERASVLTTLGQTLRLAGRRDDARASLDEAADIVRRTAGESSQAMADVREEVRLLDAAGPARRDARGPLP